MIMSSQTARNARARALCFGLDGGGDSCMKLYGMLVVSLKGINQKFWSYLGSVHYKAPLAVKVSYRVHSVLRLNSARLNSRKQGLLC